MFVKKQENKSVKANDELINRKNELEAQLARQQRGKDLELDQVEKKWEAKIDQTIREIDFNNMQIEQARIYAEKNLTTNVKVGLIKNKR